MMFETFKARSIQELAKKDFENLRQDSDDSEPQPQPQPKIARRGRPPKNLKKSLETSPSDRIASEFPSGATLANGIDTGGWSNGHNLRRIPTPSYRFRPAEASTRASHGFHASDSHHNNSQYDWENEFPGLVYLKLEFVKCNDMFFVFFLLTQSGTSL